MKSVGIGKRRLMKSEDDAEARKIHAKNGPEDRRKLHHGDDSERTSLTTE